MAALKEGEMLMESTCVTDPKSINQFVHLSWLLLMPYTSQVLLTEETEKERAARVAALEDGEMLMESPLPSSSTPAHPHSMQPGQQGRASWPLASPALSPGASTMCC